MEADTITDCWFHLLETHSPRGRLGFSVITDHCCQLRQKYTITIFNEIRFTLDNHILILVKFTLGNCILTLVNYTLVKFTVGDLILTLANS